MSETWRLLPAIWRALTANAPEFSLSLGWNLWVAIVPAIAFLCLFYEQDTSKGKSHGARLKVFLLGLTTVIPAIFLELWFARLFLPGRLSELEGPTGPLDFDHLVTAFLLGFVLSASIEELVKLYYLSVVKQMKQVSNRKAMIVYSVLLGLAFASAENISYVLTFHDNLPSIGVGRALIALPMHGVCAVLMGYFVGEAELTKPQEKPTLYFRAWAIATLIHGSYNTMLFSKLPLGGIMALLILGISLVFALILCWQLRRSEPVGPAKPSTQAIAPSSPTLQLSTKISAFLNRSLKEKGITAKVTTESDDQLTIVLLASKAVPEQLAEWVHQGLRKLDLASIQSVRVASRKFGTDTLQWQHQFELSPRLATDAALPQPAVPASAQPRPIRHHGFSLMAVLFGLLADICSTNIVVFMVGVGLGVFSTTQEISEESWEALLQSPGMHWLLLGVALIGSVFGGWIAAYLAGKYEIRHALGSGILAMMHSYALYSALESDQSAWFDAITILLVPLAAILGGTLCQGFRRLRQRQAAPTPSSYALM